MNQEIDTLTTYDLSKPENKDLNTKLIVFLTENFKRIQDLFSQEVIDLFNGYMSSIRKLPEKWEWDYKLNSLDSWLHLFRIIQNTSWEIVWCLWSETRMNEEVEMSPWNKEERNIVYSRYAFVDKDSQGQGIGSKLKQELEAYAQELAWSTSIVSNVHKDNARSIKWNKKNGYTPYQWEDTGYIQFYKDL